jgi:hypothetical protein
MRFFGDMGENAFANDFAQGAPAKAGRFLRAYIVLDLSRLR